MQANGSGSDSEGKGKKGGKKVAKKNVRLRFVFRII
jgi:hypothetical protein